MLGLLPVVMRAEEKNMAGRFQGRHVFVDAHGSQREVDVYWHGAGWFWRSLQTRGDAAGPFTTSSEAYEDAKAAGRGSKSGVPAFDPHLTP